MGKTTESSNWGALGIASAGGGVGLNVQGSVYLLRNQDNGNRFLFLLADFGPGFSWGGSSVSPRKVLQLVKSILRNSSVNDPSSYSDIPANRPFSADDLHFARGAEATYGAGYVVGYAVTVISAWPMFSGAPEPGVEVNNDYFSGADVRGLQTGIGMSMAYRLFGEWVRIWTL